MGKAEISKPEFIGVKFYMTPEQNDIVEKYQKAFKLSEGRHISKAAVLSMMADEGKVFIENKTREIVENLI